MRVLGINATYTNWDTQLAPRHLKFRIFQLLIPRVFWWDEFARSLVNNIQTCQSKSRRQFEKTGPPGERVAGVVVPTRVP